VEIELPKFIRRGSPGAAAAAAAAAAVGF